METDSSSLGVRAIKLLLSIKRLSFRVNDANSAEADRALGAKRRNILRQQQHICQGCGYTSKPSDDKLRSHLDVHHLDDDHHNNEDANLCVICHMCHPYQHVGEISHRSDSMAQTMGAKTAITAVPEIAPSDLNLLQRAIGVALLDPAEAEIAKGIYDALTKRSKPVERDFGSFKAADFAAAFAELFKRTPQDYDHREAYISDLRLRFSHDLLRQFGAEFVIDNKSVPISCWGEIHKNRKLTIREQKNV